MAKSLKCYLKLHGNQQPIKTNITLLRVVQQLNSERADWKSQIDSDVYDYFVTYEIKEKFFNSTMGLHRQNA